MQEPNNVEGHQHQRPYQHVRHTGVDAHVTILEGNKITCYYKTCTINEQIKKNEILNLLYNRFADCFSKVRERREPYQDFQLQSQATAVGSWQYCQ